MKVLAGFSQRSLLLGSLVLSLVACTRAEYELKRPFEQMTDLVVEHGQIGRSTRSFVRFPPGGEAATKIPLGPLRRGLLRTHLAVEPVTGGASAELELRGAGFFPDLLEEETSTCRHEWHSAADQQSWIECHLPIPSDLRSATLRIRFEGPDGSQLRVSSPILVAADAPKRADVFVIVLDTARADSFASFNANARFGERLDALARDSIVFDELRALLDHMAALHTDGWHLRGCGCDAKSVLALQIRGPEAEATRIGFEARDALVPLAEDTGFELRFDLTPAIASQQRFDRAIGTFLPDEDEIAFRRATADPGDAEWRIRPGAVGGLMLAVGNGAPFRLDDELDSSSIVEASTIQPGEPVSCRTPTPAASERTPVEGSTCQPYVRIWRVTPPRSISQSEVDPAIRERLRAMGYAW